MFSLDRISNFSKDIALINEKKENITYGQLLNYSDKISKNINKRSLIFILCSNTFESIIFYVSVLRSGSIPLLLESNISQAILDNLIQKYQPEFIVCNKLNLKNIKNCTEIFKLEKNILLKIKAKINYKINDDLALLLSTSGSTGSPKFVRLSHKNIFTNTKQIASFLPTGPSETSITTMPMSYTYGLSIINTHIINGSKIFVSERSVVEKLFWTNLNNFNVTNFGGVPFIYTILNKLNFKNIETKNLKYITQAGGKLENKLAQKIIEACDKKNIKFHMMYGQTEATARISYVPCEKVKEQLGTIGNPVEGGKIWLEDDQGNVIKKINQEGELIFSGENVCLGYSEDYKDLIKGDENNGILRTGDLAKIDPKGNYFIVGRKKRFSKIFGLRINLDDLEEKLNLKGFDCACSINDEKIIIFIRESTNFTQINDYIKKNFKIQVSGFKLVPVKEIPRTYSGKIDYARLK